MLRVLVLCHGNINRSPLCAEVLQRFPNLDVRGAGLKPRLRPGVAAKKMREAAVDNGFNLEHHRSQRLTPDLYNWAQVIVYMDGGNLRRLDLFRRYHKLRQTNNWVMLGDFAEPPERRIPDPAFIPRDDPKLEKVVHMIIDSSLRLGGALSDKVERYIRNDN